MASLLVAGAAASARAIDLHRFWDDRCQECHGHAGAFARSHLTVSNGQLFGRHHKADLKRFLSQHEMGAEHVEAIYSMLLAQAGAPPIFQEKCAGCHRSAAEFSRSSLVMTNGQLTGRGTGRPLAEYLQRHGKLSAGEIPIVVESLSRVLKEIEAPTPK